MLFNSPGIIFFCVILALCLILLKNFKKLPLAFILAILVVTAVEGVFYHFVPPERLFSHEVDRILYDLERKTYDADVVFLGDSVGGQMIRDILGTKGALAGLKKGRIADLSTNQAIEMTGQYFLFKRYLSKNKKPEGVVFISLNPFGGNLEQVYTENFVKRCFTKWSEIAEITSRKGLSFGLSMVFYKFFPSYRYRLKIQNYLFGSKKDVYRGEMLPVRDRESASTSKTDLSYDYFVKLLGLLQREGIDSYFLAAPQSSSSFERDKMTNAAMASLCLDLEKRFSRFHFRNSTAYYPDTLFYPDKTHFTQEGLRAAVPAVAAELSEIQAFSDQDDGSKTTFS